MKCLTVFYLGTHHKTNWLLYFLQKQKVLGINQEKKTLHINTFLLTSSDGAPQSRLMQSLIKLFSQRCCLCLVFFTHLLIFFQSLKVLRHSLSMFLLSDNIPLIGCKATLLTQRKLHTQKLTWPVLIDLIFQSLPSVSDGGCLPSAKSYRNNSLIVIALHDGTLSTIQTFSIDAYLDTKMFV